MGCYSAIFRGNASPPRPKGGNIRSDRATAEKKLVYNLVYNID